MFVLNSNLSVTNSFGLKSFFVLMLIIFSHNLSANAYQLDFSIKQGHSAEETFFLGREVQLTKNDFTRASLAYYFQPVDTTSLPLKKAAFLSKSSSAFFSTILTTNDYIFDAQYISDQNFWMFRSEFVLKDSALDTATFSIGKYLVPHILLFAQFQEADDNDAVAVVSESVLKLQGQSFLGVLGSVSYDKNEDLSTELIADYFFTPRFSLGARTGRVDNQSQWELNSTYFISTNISGELTYIRTDVNDIPVDGQQYTANFDANFYSLQINTRF